MTVNCSFHMTFASFAVQAERCSPNEQLLRTCLSPVCLLWDKTTCSVALLFREKNSLVITRCCYLICLINPRKYPQLFHSVGIWCEGWISYTGIFVLACKRGRVGLGTLLRALTPWGIMSWLCAGLTGPCPRMLQDISAVASGSDIQASYHVKQNGLCVHDFLD